jgi:hypothetical protein
MTASNVRIGIGAPFFDRSHFAAPAAFARDWRKIDWFCEDGW